MKELTKLFLASIGGATMLLLNVNNASAAMLYSMKTTVTTPGALFGLMSSGTFQTNNAMDTIESVNFPGYDGGIIEGNSITLTDSTSGFFLYIPSVILPNTIGGMVTTTGSTQDTNTPGFIITKDVKITKIPIPEPTSTLGLLAFGTLGAASTLKRQLKPSQSIEKETTKAS
jgi:hypothetical protein